MVTAEEPPFITREEFERRFDDVDAELGELREGQQRLERRMTKLEERMTVIEHRFNDFKESVNHRFNALDKRFDDFKESVNHRFDEMNRRITVLMWGIALSNAGIFAVLGWIISRLD